MKPQAIIGFLALMLAAFACKEAELPDEFTDQPDFYAEGKIGGKEIRLVAGEDGYYMKTLREQDDKGVFMFRGAFTRLDCEPCTESLKITLRDARQAPPDESVIPADAFKTGPYAYYFSSNPDENFVYRVSFTNESTGAGPFTYQWNMGDGTVHQGQNPVHTYDDSLTQIEVCLDATDPSGCTTSICNVVDLEDTLCRSDFTHYRYPGTQYVEFSARPTGKAPFTYRWNFGDGYGASLGNPGYFFANPDVYRVCLTITDAEGCRSTICKNIAADPALCESNFTYQVEKTVVPNPLQFSTVIVSWTDAQGKKYSTA
ncbi:MAG: hypothetical protein EAZ89_06475, partial [Bacteroidetes bacterium]